MTDEQFLADVTDALRYALSYLVKFRPASKSKDLAEFFIRATLREAYVRRGSSVVEHSSEKAGVVGSIPTPGTLYPESTPKKDGSSSEAP
jgi:hypothetical protein